MAESASFRPKARILQLLGDELIGSPRLAVFELVKNAYDADATHVSVRLENIGTPKSRIVVQDNGSGMSLDIIRDIWLTPANDHRRRQRETGTRSPLGRLPLGEKGLGRFAIHKLGEQIQLVTRQVGKPEVLLALDWEGMLAHDYLDEVIIPIETREPRTFRQGKHGTRIEITRLRDAWSRGSVRDLHRSLTSIADPTGGPSDFMIEFKVPGHESWIEDLPDPARVLELALWVFSFSFDGNVLNWTYAFKPYGGIRVQPVLLTEKEPLLRTKEQGRVIADRALLLGIGPLSGSFHVYDRDRWVWNLMPQKQLVAEYLRNNGGVRIYRDGVRVYNYGEPDDDWLGLDLRRVNTPTRNISRNLILGRINIGLADSFLLREKTNREGFVEGDALNHLREVTTSVLSVLERLRRTHKEAVRAALTGVKEPVARSIDTPVAQLREALTERGLSRLVALLDEISREYEQLREIMLNSGTAGLQLSLIFHELERGVRGLVEAIHRRESIQDLEKRSGYLKDLLEGFATVLKKEPSRKHSLTKIAREAIFLNQLRFRIHNVALDFPLGRGEQEDVSVRASLGLAIGGVSNAIDNAIYWTRVRWPEDPTEGGPLARRVWIGTSEEFSEGPALIVADNGPGLRDGEEDLIRPFWTRRPGGMGLGLYYANLAMELAGGKLMFPDPADIDLPPGLDGAVVAFVFRKA